MSKLLMAQRVATVVLLALLANHFRPVYSLIKHAFIEPLPESPIDYADCQHLHSPGVDSCEHMATWYRQDGEELQILGCDPGRRSWNTVMGPTRNGSSTGNLFLVSPQNGKIQQLDLALFPVNHTFHPLGLAVWHEEDKDRLFVINHAEDMSTVEVFDLKEGPARAQWVTTLRGDDRQGFIAPNSIVALSFDSFYLTHDHYITRRKLEQQVFPFNLLPNFLDPIVPILNILETYLLLRTGSVSHVTFIPPPHPNLPTFQVSKPVLEGIPFANGIAVSPDATYALVASTSTSRVLLYSIGSDLTDPLKLIRGWDMPFHPDNIAWRSDPENPRKTIALIAGHRSSPLVSKIARGVEGIKAPSFVSQLVFPENLDAIRASKMSSIKLETVFTNVGNFGTSTSAEIDGFGALWVAGLYQEGLLRCGGVRNVPEPVSTNDEEIF